MALWHIVHFFVDDWKSDQMYWHNYGCKKLKTCHVLIKSYYVFVNPKGSDEISFKRLSYRLENDDRYLTLVHYKGDHKVMKQYKDLKKQNCASLRRELKKQEHAVVISSAQAQKRFGKNERIGLRKK